MRVTVAVSLANGNKLAQGQATASPAGRVVLSDPAGLEVPSVTAGREKLVDALFVFCFLLVNEDNKTCT